MSHGLDQSDLLRLLGYNIAQAAIPAYKLFDSLIGLPLGLRQVEFSILSLVQGNDKVTHKRLSSALGRKEVFTLDKPLRIRKGQVVALTVPTWASNFATENVSSSDNQWRASRKQGQCNTSNISNAKKSTPQQKVGSVRHYSCDYNAARILYWAYYVPK